VLLLNPGPVTLSERVRRSMLQPDLCHRESEFCDLQDEARRRLLATYSLDPAQWAAVLMTAPEAIDFADAALTAVAATANKCLHAVPGAAFVIVRRKDLQHAASVVLRAYHLPAGFAYAQLHDALKADGFVIYAGQGDLSKTLFRISTMGNLASADIDRLVLCFARLLK
jgi:aspartate aminotransferase-like enzyme